VRASPVKLAAHLLNLTTHPFHSASGERARLEVQLEESNATCSSLLRSSTTADSELQRMGLQLTQTKALFADARRQADKLRAEAGSTRDAHAAELRKMRAGSEATEASAAQERCATPETGAGAVSRALCGL